MEVVYTCCIPVELLAGEGGVYQWSCWLVKVVYTCCIPVELPASEGGVYMLYSSGVAG